MTTRHFEFFSTPLSGLIVIKRQAIEDDRGFLCRFYCSEEFKDIGLNKSIVQVNHTLTKKKGSVRGLHFQHPPHAETKFVSCLKGEIFDVAVDIRHNSPTFLHWYSEILSDTNRKSLLIPEGFAHGFQSMTNDCELIYLHTESYMPSAEGGLNVRDVRLNITWPLNIAELSKRDQAYRYIDGKFEGMHL
jgi:dTDP-4-dehydrorhamnose 3,5-epimerase